MAMTMKIVQLGNEDGRLQFFAVQIGIYQIGATIGVHTGPYPIGIGIVRHAEV